MKLTKGEIARRVPSGLLTAGSVVWTVAAIGGLLGRIAPDALAFTVAGIYDAVWLYMMWLEAQHRRQGSDGTTPARLGWAFLALTVGILFAHGWTEAGWAIGALGAVIPVLAKSTLAATLAYEESRISGKAQSAIDRTRAATRDRIAVTRAVQVSRAEQAKAGAEIERVTRQAEGEALTVTHQARQEYAEVAERHPMPEAAGTVPGLISDDDLEALLAGGTPGEVSAGGMGVSGSSGGALGMGPGRGELEAGKEANDKAVAMLAAELYAADPPPSLTQFRKAMRAEMNDRGLTGSWATVDELYRREKDLRSGADTDV